MSDLISRNAVFEEIKHGKNRPKIYDGAQEVDWIMECINQVPIAYDVNKVVEQLKKYLPLGCSDNEELMPVCKAVEIVKGGGQGE